MTEKTEAGETLPIDRTRLLAAFDAIARAAAVAGAKLEIAVYGGSALMLAGNFRFATEDVDVAEIGHPWPVWLQTIVRDIGQRNGWSADWLNEAVTFHLSPHADRAADHAEFGIFPHEGPPSLHIVVPSADYMLALKLRAIRILDPAKGTRRGRRHLQPDAPPRGRHRRGPRDPAAVLPQKRRGRCDAALSPQAPEAERHGKERRCARLPSLRPAAALRAARRNRSRSAILQAFYTQPSIPARGAMLKDEPAPSGDGRLDALVGGIAEYLFKRWAPDHPPGWPCDRSRYLREPWWPHAGDDPALREYLTWMSPSEFKSRNIMTEPEPLRRAVTPPVVPIT